MTVMLKKQAPEVTYGTTVDGRYSLQVNGEEMDDTFETLEEMLCRIGTDHYIIGELAETVRQLRQRLDEIEDRGRTLRKFETTH